jgi:hypothetical protein
MSSSTIKSAKLTKIKKGQGLLLSLEEKDRRGDDVNDQKNHKGLIHPDLKAAFNRLRPHLAIMCGYVKSIQVEDIAMPDESLFDNFHVHAYSIGGNEDSEGVVISGHYIVPESGLSVTLNTPFRRMEQAPDTRYIFMDDVVAAIRTIEQEVAMFLNGKRGKEPGTENQGELELKDAPPDNSVLGRLENANPEAMDRIRNDGKPKPSGNGRAPKNKPGKQSEEALPDFGTT